MKNIVFSTSLNVKGKCQTSNQIHFHSRVASLTKKEDNDIFLYLDLFLNLNICSFQRK